VDLPPLVTFKLEVAPAGFTLGLLPPEEALVEEAPFVALVPDVVPLPPPPEEDLVEETPLPPGGVLDFPLPPELLVEEAPLLPGGVLDLPLPPEEALVEDAPFVPLAPFEPLGLLEPLAADVPAV